MLYCCLYLMACGISIVVVAFALVCYFFHFVLANLYTCYICHFPYSVSVASVVELLYLCCHVFMIDSESFGMYDSCTYRS
jgi:hypothetical protein